MLAVLLLHHLGNACHITHERIGEDCKTASCKKNLRGTSNTQYDLHPGLHRGGRGRFDSKQGCRPSRLKSGEFGVSICKQAIASRAQAQVASETAG